MTDYPPQSFLLFQTAYSSPQPTGDFSSYEDTFQLDYATTCDAENLPQCPPLRHPLSRFERPCAQPSTPLEPQCESFIGPIRSRLRNVHRRMDAAPFPPRSKAPSPESLPNKSVRKNEPFQCPVSTFAVSSFIRRLSSSSLDRWVYQGEISRFDLSLIVSYSLSQSYRNANGLKYHREKGKCVFDNDGSVDPQPPAIPASLTPQPTLARPRPLASAPPKRILKRRSTRYPARSLTRISPIDHLNTRAQAPLSSSSSSSSISPITPPLSPCGGAEVFLDEHPFADTDSVITVDGILSFRQQPKVSSADESTPLLSSSSRHQSPSFLSRSLSPLTIYVSRSASPDIAAPSPCVPAPAELLERLNDLARNSLGADHELSAESDYYERSEVMDMVSKSIEEGAGDNHSRESEFQILQTLFVNAAGLGASEGERAHFCW